MRIGLGTVQFGQEYGISNKKGKPSHDELKKIVNKAYESRMRFIDTAPSYNCENILGELFAEMKDLKIVTKTPHFTAKIIKNEEVQELEDSFQKSLLNLKREKVYGLLVHNSDDLLKPGGNKIWNKMLDLKLEGFVKKVGASVYTDEQIDSLLENYQLDIIQLPVNVLDQRLIRNGYLKKLKRLGVEIQARSVFLQGLLLMNPDELPPYFAPIKEHLKKYHEYIKDCGITPIEAAINFVLSFSEIDYSFIGANSYNEIEEIVSAINANKSHPDLSNFFLDNMLVLNPSKWLL